MDDFKVIFDFLLEDSFVWATFETVTFLVDEVADWTPLVGVQLRLVEVMVLFYYSLESILLF